MTISFQERPSTQQTPTPTQNYEAACQRIAALQALDTKEVNPLSRTSFLTHDSKTSRAILMLHGYTNSPRQYRILASDFFQRGYNVLAPRFPHHGLQDRMTPALIQQTERGLLSFTQETVDIAMGLGEQLTVLGLSMGGVMALWIAQHRADVSLACAISPALAFHAIPLTLTPLVIRLFLLLPNQFRWWDAKLKDAPMPPFHAYPRYSTRGLAHIVNIGLKVRALSRHAKPQAGSVLMMLNPTDESVNHDYAREIATNWTALGIRNLRSYEFDIRHNLIHDLIDPDQPKQQIDVVYPVLLDMLTN